MAQAATSLEQLQSMLTKDTRINVLNLQNCTTDYCFGAYIMRKQHISDVCRRDAANCRRILANISRDIPTYRFDEDFNETLFFYLLNHEKVRPSTAQEYLHRIVAVLGWAGKHGAELSDTYTHVPKLPYQAHSIALTMSEIAQMFHFDIDTLPYRKDKRENLGKVRDTFVMNCIGYGLRYSDLSRLEQSNFSQDGTLTIVQKKTGRIVHSDTDLIYYRDIYDSLQAKYPNHEIPYQRNIGNFNHYLKDFCKHLHGSFDNIEALEYRVDGNIIHEEKPRWQCISSHVARRTFVTCNISAMQHSVVKVQHGVGHAQSSTTDRYILDNKVI